MLFNSFEFLLFLPTVFLLYWFVFQKNLKIQNVLLLGVSYLFYGWWDWRFLSLIVISSVIDYIAGREIEKSESHKRKKAFLILSMAVNLGFLGFFKYYNFFMENFAEMISTLGMNPNYSTLKIVLPVGISFYTFQTMSYTIDVYRGKLKASNDPIAFFAFVSFFPQLVAGPIERATNLLPQFNVKRNFSKTEAIDGMRQILWGFFKKIAIADMAAPFVNNIFSNVDAMPSGALFLGAILFAFQIYGDFSGYSDIAIGTSRLFGFNLMQNFAFPYFSRDIAEFWRRWHISLSTWFRDYLYIPLGGSRGSRLNQLRNIFIIFIVSGFWHGANWTFIIWGALNAIYFLPTFFANKNRKHLDVVAQNTSLPNLREILQIGVTFGMTVFAWIFFRADSINDAVIYIKKMFTGDIMNFTENMFENTREFHSFLFTFVFIAMLIGIEWMQRRKQHGLQDVFSRSPILRRTLYFILAGIIMLFISNEATTFIYFQF
ncbi:MAG: alginate O-acetyltransferase complex protein AlgI [Patiriisocius sp.]|jgi:alginate O-acetyltransferase complex protein AlgI